MSHTMKLSERVVEAGLHSEVSICKKQYGAIPRKSTRSGMFCLQILMEKCRDSRRELHCVFVN